ncbi:hypothetical protein Pan189_01570 [Stratiformator vulcanicus]|uniref:Transglutaminase-like superfamily protein n=2 Tax=Stratiformator vulcanicus TaxID=2527980 RepID=A0A517QW21_9PLAN|nr:hypothetical protein Pan189_01570 [Stratiformator vulcanicus]
MAMLLVGVALAPLGCTRRPPPVQTGNADEDSCTDLLDSAMPLLEPGTLGVSADTGRAVQLLSQWISNDDCDFQDAVEPLDEEDSELLERLFTKEDAATVAQLQFGEEDVIHVRDRILDRRMAEGLTKNLDSDRERIAHLFDSVVQNIALIPPGGTEIPLSTFNITLIGRGTAADRAWVFVELLRQLQLDSVIIRPQLVDGDAADGDRLFVGVTTLDGILLFDPAAGIPVPSADQVAPADRSAAELAVTASIRPATLKEVVADPTLLTAYDSASEPIAAEQLMPPRVSVIATTSHARGAVDVLEQSLAGEYTVRLYDPLHNSSAGPGLIDRISRFGEGIFTADDVTLWDYPQRRMKEARRLSESDQSRLRLRLIGFDAPVEINRETQSETRTGRQREARLEMLSGRPVQAIKEFQLIRIDERFGNQTNVRPDIRTMYRQATDDAFYWTALCQFERGGANFPTSAATAARYVENGSGWVAEAQRLQATALAASGEFEKALEVVDRCRADGIDTTRLNVLAERWRTKQDADTAEDSAVDESSE